MDLDLVAEARVIADQMAAATRRLWNYSLAMTRAVDDFDGLKTTFDVVHDAAAADLDHLSPRRNAAPDPWRRVRHLWPGT